MSCANSCVDVRVDRSNCGGCGTVCAAGEVCSAGSCALSCQIGLATCGGKAPVCTNLASDNLNCGACGVACGKNAACVGGACRWCTTALQLPSLPLVDVGSGVKLADFDEDGKLDMVGLESGSVPISAGLRVALGNGNGTFRAAVKYPVALSLWPVVTDLDGDGHLDLVTGADGKVEVLRGRGDGTFDPPVISTPAYLGVIVLAGDLDGDGSADLVASSDGDVTILRNVQGAGKGFLADAHSFPLGVFHVELADVDGDGDRDVMTGAVLANQIDVLVSNGSGTFVPGPTTGIPAGVGRFAAVRLDGDPKVDLVIAANDGIRTLLGNGDGTFTAKAVFATNDVGYMKTADADGDGNLDVLLSGSSVRMFRGVGDGTLSAPVTWTRTSGAPLGVADFDGDQKLDFFVETFSSGGAVLYLNQGNGFLQPTAFATNPDLGVWSRAAADFDGDGRVDIVTAGGIRRNLGGGSFAPENAAGIGTANGQVGDWNGDGHPDLLTGFLQSWLLIGDGQGGFASKVQLQPGFAVGDAAFADFDGDGSLDISLTPRFSAGSIYVQFGDGKGGFGPTFSPSVTTSVMVAGDFNADGKDDLVTFAAPKVRTLFGTASKTLVPGPTAPYDFYVSPYEALAADVDGDGKLDAVLRGALDNLYVLRGKGDGSFEYPVTLAMYGHPTSVQISLSGLAVGDLDGDGRKDLAVAAGTRIIVRLGTPTGFAPPLSYPVAAFDQGYLRGLALADFDGDGRVDVVAGHSLLSNRGTTICGLAKK